LETPGLPEAAAQPTYSVPRDQVVALSALIAMLNGIVNIDSQNIDVFAWRRTRLTTKGVKCPLSCCAHGLESFLTSN
jgi:hypothetical protein